MRKTDPVEARKGTFLDSFENYTGNVTDNAPDEVIGYCAAAEASLKSLHVDGEIVYTQIPHWGKRKGHTWQVFAILNNDGKESM